MNLSDPRYDTPTMQEATLSDSYNFSIPVIAIIAASAVAVVVVVAGVDQPDFVADKDEAQGQRAAQPHKKLGLARLLGKAGIGAVKAAPEARPVGARLWIHPRTLFSW